MSSNNQRRNAQVFSRLARDYDKLNDLMTLGLHHLWRRRLASAAGFGNAECVLDLACGTGDAACEILNRYNRIEVHLVDSNAAMLKEAKAKLTRKGLLDRGCLTLGDAHDLPYPSAKFDGVVICFGLRLDGDMFKTLTEVWRVLKRGGFCLALDLSQPQSYWLKPAVGFYLKTIVPWLSRWTVRTEYDRHYLPDSAGSHPDPMTITYLFERAGFTACEYESVMGGALAMHCAMKEV